MDLPHTFDAWEKRLVDYFLAIGPDGDASPIRSFEVTPRTLTLAWGAPPGSDAAVEEAFRRMLSRDLLLMDSLRLGSQRYIKPDVPNCFSYLAFTLLIDNLLEGNTIQSGEFRDKLVKWLGIDSTVSDLRGIALMWESLVRWLDDRVHAGEPFRRLILPNPGSWTHIGYTRRLSFPSNADLRLVMRFCEKHPDALRDPLASIRAFPRELEGQLSWGLNRAYFEFRGAYYRQRRALGDLPFWRLLERASALVGHPTRCSVTVEMLFDADKRALFFASSGEVGETEPFVSLNDALIAVRADRSENLAISAALGIMFFRLVGAGRWQAEPEANDSAYGLHVAVADRHKLKIGEWLGPLASSGAWAITTKPQSLETVKAVLKAAKLLAEKLERIVRLNLSGGVRTEGVWLGRPRFLPTLESDTTDYVIRNASPHATDVPLTIEQGQLKISRQIDGAYFIRPSALPNEEHTPWSIRLQFSSNAFVHKSLESARFKLPLLHDWKPGTSARLDIYTQDDLVWESGDSACVDLLEAVYASGRSGWEEAELITLLGCSDDAMNPWLLLRALRDAGVIKPHLRAGWKGRVWTLREPSIVEGHCGGQVLALVEGALCTRLIEDFRLAVEGFGGIAFQRMGSTPWAVPLVGARNLSAKALAELLGWRFVAEPIAPTEQPLAFAETQHQALHYEPAATWSWEMGRFLSSSNIEKDVQLVRLTHTGGRDHDIYRVEQNGNKFHYLSRTAAIVSAHAIARVPLFKWSPEKELISIGGREGGLPDALATETRRRVLRNAGPLGNEYVYPANHEVVRWLAGQLPGCITGMFEEQLDVPSLISLARRSSGQVRLQWRNGTTTL